MAAADEGGEQAREQIPRITRFFVDMISMPPAPARPRKPRARSHANTELPFSIVLLTRGALRTRVCPGTVRESHDNGKGNARQIAGGGGRVTGQWRRIASAERANARKFRGSGRLRDRYCGAPTLEDLEARLAAGSPGEDGIRLGPSPVRDARRAPRPAPRGCGRDHGRPRGGRARCRGHLRSRRGRAPLRRRRPARRPPVREPRGRGSPRRRAPLSVVDAGLSVGHQVVDIGEALELAQTRPRHGHSLLRPPAPRGRRAILAELEERAYAGLFSEGELARFVERLEEEAAARHARFGGSLYLLEPE